MFTEACDEPLKRITGVFDVSELACERRITAQVFHLLLDNATAKLLGTSKLKTTTKEELRGVDTTTDPFGKQRAKAWVFYSLEITSIGLRVHRDPITSGERSTRLA